MFSDLNPFAIKLQTIWYFNNWNVY